MGAGVSVAVAVGVWVGVGVKVGVGVDVRVGVAVFRGGLIGLPLLSAVGSLSGAFPTNGR